MKHKWIRTYAVEGGLRENPGVWGISGAAIAMRQHCQHCGVSRRRVFGDVDTPSRNHGWKYGRIEDADYPDHGASKPGPCAAV